MSRQAKRARFYAQQRRLRRLIAMLRREVIRRTVRLIDDRLMFGLCIPHHLMLKAQANDRAAVARILPHLF